MHRELVAVLECLDRRLDTREGSEFGGLIGGHIVADAPAIARAGAEGTEARRLVLAGRPITLKSFEVQIGQIQRVSRLDGQRSMITSPRMITRSISMMTALPSCSASLSRSRCGALS